MAHPLITAIPGKVSLKYIQGQGWNAKLAGFSEKDCPYYATSPAANAWLKGFRS